MKISAFITMVIALFITSCTGTFEVGIERSHEAPTEPAIATISATSVAALPSETPFLENPTSTPFAEVQTATEPAGGTQLVNVFLIALEDNGQSGLLVGCGDSAVPIQVEVPRTQGVLGAALESLLAIRVQYYGESGLYNALYQSDLHVESISSDAGQVRVYLSGTLLMGGECDGPRVQAQLEQTVLQFPTFTEVQIFINGRPLMDVLSLRG